MRKFIGFAAIVLSAVIPVFFSIAGSSASSLPPGIHQTFHRTVVHGTNESATTAMSLRPDSGYNGPIWALDDFSRTVNIQRIATVNGTKCGLEFTHACYEWLAVFNDLKGTFQTLPGDQSPGFNDLTLQVTERGTFAGTQEEVVYDSYANAFPGDVPLTENDNGLLDGVSSTQWPCQFFGNAGFCHPAGAETFSYSYTVPAGNDTQCSTKSWHWLDATEGNISGTGDILAPNKATCSATPST